MSFIQNIFFLNHFVNIFIEFLDDLSHSSATHGRMGAVRNDSQKSFKKDEKSAAIDLKYYYRYVYDICLDIYLDIYFFYHFVNVSSNFYMTGHVYPRILSL